MLAYIPVPVIPPRPSTPINPPMVQECKYQKQMQDGFFKCFTEVEYQQYTQQQKMDSKKATENLVKSIKSDWWKWLLGVLALFIIIMAL